MADSPLPFLDLVKYIQTAGGPVAVIFAALYWLERGERQDAQKELKDVAEKSINSMNEAQRVLGQMANIFSVIEKK